jgi:uncharacterized protein YegL
MMKNHVIYLFFLFLVCLAAAGLATEEADVHKSNVVIILDASGSMRKNMAGTRIQKMDAAKTALKEVLKTVPKHTNIGIRFYSGQKNKHDWVYPLGPRDDQKLTISINMIQAGGGTPLGYYIKKGADRLLQEKTRQMGYGSYRLLIVTDGEAQDSELMEKNTPDVLSRGIVMDVIGVEMSQRHTLANKANSYRKANDPVSLKKAIAEVFAEVSDTGTGNLSQDAFEIIKPLSDDVAEAMLDALTASDNSPIGEHVRSGEIRNRQ